MTYTILFQKIEDKDFPSGYYYAHIPSFDITTHGSGIEGAREAVKDLVKIWIEEKKAEGEKVEPENEFLISKIEMEDALFI